MVSYAVFASWDVIDAYSRMTTSVKYKNIKVTELQVVTELIS